MLKNHTYSPRSFIDSRILHVDVAVRYELGEIKAAIDLGHQSEYHV